LKVFLDTNVLVSAFATRGLCADVLRRVLLEHDLVTSELVIEELRRVLRVRIKLPESMIDEIESLLREHEVVPSPRTPADLAIRDVADRLILAAALDAKADVLVTGDRDLLDVAAAAPVPILDPRGFWTMLRGGRKGR
jgi:putative PIN family toxin of toxin-antitoxin system